MREKGLVLWELNKTLELRADMLPHIEATKTLTCNAWEIIYFVEQTCT